MGSVGATTDRHNEKDVLARTVGSTDPELLLFALDDRRFGLHTRSVREIVRAVTIVPLPGAPAVVEGVVNARGKIVPVLDIRGRFGLRAKALELADHLILAWAGPRFVALRADRALDVVRVPSIEIEACEGLVKGAHHVAGVARLPDGVVLIHDLETFLSQAEAQALDQALATASAPREGS